MLKMLSNAWLIPIPPAVAFVLIVLVTKRFKLLSALLAIFAITLSFIYSIGILLEVLSQGITMNNPVEYSVNWLSLGGETIRPLLIEAGVLIDPLTSVMLVVVTLVALLVEIYSLGYMKGDPGFSVFFGYLSFFVMSMLGLVLANNYFMMFIFWELVGLCSYLLIGFYFHKHSAAKASKKAFITNRWGDFGFMLGIFSLFLIFGTFNFNDLAEAIGRQHGAFLIIPALLVLAGPIAKSAQFPLHVWLPDAMEGPTPVSALIHAATMVAAGVYLIARGYILFTGLEAVSFAIAYIGGFTALFAAIIAVVQFDIKRIIAFSTVSQLGYMVMALGVGSLSAGIFHLTTHAFFKALLFLAAGSVIHAAHTQNIFEMGGLSKSMKITTWSFIVGALSLSGIFPLAGFWSKDEILLVTLEKGFTGLYIIGSLVAFLTAFYVFRLVFVVFFGKKKTRAYESPLSMTVPLMVLAFLSITSGFAGAPFVEKGFSSFIYFQEPHHVQVNFLIMIGSTVLALGGIALAWAVYVKKLIDPVLVTDRARSLYVVVYNKFYIDEIYHWLFYRIMMNIGKAFNWNDRHVVDGIFDGIAGLTRAAGAKLRLVHTGNLQNYALVIFASVVIIVIWMAVPVLGGIQ